MTPPDLAGRTTWRTDLTLFDGDRERVPLSEANLISSLCTDGEHRPVIDLDFPCRLEPSTTPGHFHLYLDKAVPWDAYVKVLEAMKEAGLVQAGFHELAVHRGATFVRPPGVRKTDNERGSG